MSGVQHMTVGPDEDGMRLDRWFRGHFPAVRHGMLQKLLRSGQIRVDGSRAKANVRLSEAQAIRVPPLSVQPAATERGKHPIDAEDAEFVRSLVLHRDGSVIAINKPAGLAVQGGSKTERHLDGMLDALRFDAADRPRLVHRLDKDTSGVLLLARSRTAAAKLTAAFKARDAEKIYWALVEGVPRPDRGTIDLPLLKAGHAGDQRMVPATRDDEGSLPAISDFVMIDHAARRYSWLALAPHTGRTHQVRVHCAEIGCPIVGDGKYGHVRDDTSAGFDRRLHLLARSITLTHPDGGELTVAADLPAHMSRAWSTLGFDEKDQRARDPFGDEGGRG